MKKNDFTVIEKKILVYKNDNEIILDLSDRWIVDMFTIHIGLRGYATVSKNKKQIYVHHLVLGKKEGFVTDHINRNKLDNRKENLRFITRAENNRNRMSRGYWYDDKRNNFYTYGRLDSKRIFLGRFDTEDDAKIAVHNFRRLYQPYLL